MNQTTIEMKYLILVCFCFCAIFGLKAQSFSFVNSVVSKEYQKHTQSQTVSRFNEFSSLNSHGKRKVKSFTLDGAYINAFELGYCFPESGLSSKLFAPGYKFSYLIGGYNDNFGLMLGFGFFHFPGESSHFIQKYTSQGVNVTMNSEVTYNARNMINGGFRFEYILSNEFKLIPHLGLGVTVDVNLKQNAEIVSVYTAPGYLPNTKSESFTSGRDAAAMNLSPYFGVYYGENVVWGLDFVYAKNITTFGEEESSLYSILPSEEYNLGNFSHIVVQVKVIIPLN